MVSPAAFLLVQWLRWHQLQRLETLQELGCQVEPVYFTPHDYFEEQPFVNTAYGWSAADLRSFHSRWGGFIRNLHLASDIVAEQNQGQLERAMADFTRQN